VNLFRSTRPLLGGEFVPSPDNSTTRARQFQTRLEYIPNYVKRNVSRFDLVLRVSDHLGIACRKLRKQRQRASCRKHVSLLELVGTESIRSWNSGFLQVDCSGTYRLQSAVLAVNTGVRCGKPVATLITPYKQYPELTAD
jgi:hypothetical protein